MNEAQTSESSDFGVMESRGTGPSAMDEDGVPELEARERLAVKRSPLFQCLRDPPLRLGA